MPQLEQGERNKVSKLGEPEVIQKRSSGGSMGYVLDADFWGVSEISFVRLQTCGPA
jgi:hypothetical protein